MKHSFNFISVLSIISFVTIILSCGDSPNKESSVNDLNKKQYRWRMTTTWPPNFPILGEVAIKYATWVEEMSDGQLKIKVYGGGELVPALEAFDAVSNGTIEMGSGASYYWAGKIPAAQFFSTVPFGMNNKQMTSWITSGDGNKLWKEVYAKYNLVPFIGGNTGVQMGGWFNKEINSVKDFNGLKMRIPGIGGKVLERIGGAAVLVAGGEIFTSLERGIIDATEWVGPYHDYKMGFHKIAKYYYYPGWHEPGTQFEFFVNKQHYDGLPNNLKTILDAASKKAHIWVVSELEKQNSIYLDKILKNEKIEIREFSKEVLYALREQTKIVIEEMINKDTLSKKIYKSYLDYQSKNKKWSELSEMQFYNKIQEK